VIPLNVLKSEKITKHNMDDGGRLDPLLAFFRALSQGVEPDAALRAYLTQVGPRRYVEGLTAVGQVAQLASQAIERLYESIVPGGTPAVRPKLDVVLVEGPRKPGREPTPPIRQVPDPESTAVSEDAAIITTAPTAGPEVIKMLGSLKPNYRELRHVAPGLAQTLGILSVPRAGSRGNALLFVLENYAPPTGVSLEDLVFAFETMHVFPRSDPDNRRKVNWEINALQRRGWPIRRDGPFYWLDKNHRR
jgi:hypothetical protein